MLSALTFQSCDNDNDTDWDRFFPNALVTVKKSGDACYLQLDDNTTPAVQYQALRTGTVVKRVVDAWPWIAVTGSIVIGGEALLLLLLLHRCKKREEDD